MIHVPSLVLGTSPAAGFSSARFPASLITSDAVTSVRPEIIDPDFWLKLVFKNCTFPGSGGKPLFLSLRHDVLA